MIEIGLDEYRLYEDKVVLNEINSYIQSIFEIADTQNMYPVIIDTYIFKAKLEEIKGNFESAMARSFRY